MNLPKIPRYTRYEKIITLIVIVFLLTHAFFPQYINIDRFTMLLLGVLLLIAIMPSVSSAKLPYILEFKRKLSKGDEKDLMSLSEKTEEKNKSPKAKT